MTPYHERHKAGHYTTGNTSTATDTGTTAITTEMGSEATLAELQAQAEALGLPTYGTKAQIAQRIADNQ